ncbi:MAG: hypothetical protein JWP51_166 [Bradyrhizobium sp.]|jgi:hypothetical protein|nr:hypothetical protein [Bradyrhizobium sp.]
MPAFHFWFSGAALFLAGSFGFAITVGLVGIRQMVSYRLFNILIAIAVLLSGLAWRTAAKQESDSDTQVEQIGVLRKGLQALTDTLKLPEGLSIQETTSAIFKRMEATKNQLDESKSMLLQLQSSVDKLNTTSRTPPSDVLSNEDADPIASALRPFAASGAKVSIGYAASEPNAYRAAQQWLKILADAGWPLADQVMSARISAPPDVGIKIYVKSATTPGAGVLQHAFLSLGKTADGILSPGLQDNEIQLVFGAR